MASRPVWHVDASLHQAGPVIRLPTSSTYDIPRGLETTFATAIAPSRPLVLPSSAPFRPLPHARREPIPRANPQSPPPPQQPSRRDYTILSHGRDADLVWTPLQGVQPVYHREPQRTNRPQHHYTSTRNFQLCPIHDPCSHHFPKQAESTRGMMMMRRRRGREKLN